VRPDRLVDARPAGEATHDPPSGVPVEALAVATEEDRPVDAFADGQVDRTGGSRRQWDGDNLAALAVHSEGTVAALKAEGFGCRRRAPQTRIRE